MPYLMIRHKIADFEKWKPVFDEHAAVRRSTGSRGGYLFRSVDDPQELLILIETDDLDKARQFAESEDLRQTMQRAGVIDKPDFHFLEQIERFPA